MRRTLAVVACSSLLLGCCNKPDPAQTSVPAKTDTTSTTQNVPSPAKTAEAPPAQTAAPQSGTTTASTAPAAPAAALTEREKIEKLIAALETSSDTFNRNGTDYPAKEAAAHMRSKLSAAGDRVKTVKQFIDGIGSTSSMSGKPYTVKKVDGTTVNAKDWREAQLAVIEKVGK